MAERENFYLEQVYETFGSPRVNTLADPKSYGSDSILAFEVCNEGDVTYNKCHNSSIRTVHQKNLSVDLARVHPLSTHLTRIL